MPERVNRFTRVLAIRSWPSRAVARLEVLLPEGGSGPADPDLSEGDSTSGERLRPLATRRDFLVGAGAGAVAVGVVAGAGIAVTRGNTQIAPAPAVQTGPGPAVAVPPA